MNTKLLERVSLNGKSAPESFAVKERPVLFSDPMVCAIFEGRKTQTRRLVKPVGKDEGFVIVEREGGSLWPYRSDDGESLFHTVKRGGKEYLDETPHACPYGKPGDRLWVREVWRYIDGGAVYDAAGGVMDSHDPETIYRASRPSYPGPWKPSIHMPRWASRIDLEITGVRVERLNDISAKDAWAEGIPHSPDVNPVHEFEELWESINGPGSWAANRFVWVVEFKRVAR